jgi:hypothetical protein
MKKKSGEERSETAFKRYQDRIMAEDNRYASVSEPVDVLDLMMRVHLERVIHIFYAKRSLLKTSDRFSDYLRKLSRAFRRTEAKEDLHRSKD